MTIATFFEPAGTMRGVLALELVGSPNSGGIIVNSLPTTNTPDVGWEWQAVAAPVRDVDATLREITERYDNLFRRLAD